MKSTQVSNLDFYDPEDDDFCDEETEYIELFGSRENYEIFRKKVEQSSNIDCKHKEVFEESGFNVCKTCGEQLVVISHDAEWRYYSDGRSSRDPSRCHKLKSQSNSLEKIFTDKNIQLPDAIKNEIEQRYIKITKGSTTRGDRRLGIVAACNFYVCQDMDDNRTSDEIRNLYGIPKKKMSEGVRKYLEVFREARVKLLKPEDLIRRILPKAGIQFSHYKNILQICKQVENRSSMIEQSQPQSVAAAIVYLYLCMHPQYKKELGLTTTVYAQKVGLSDMTVNKLTNEASEIVGVVLENEK